MRRHFERYCEFYGEADGAKHFRKVAPWYAKRFGPSRPFKTAIITINSRADFEAALTGYLDWRRQFCDEQGELLPKFQPDPLVASFLRDPDDPVFARDSIPVPKGPVETW
jgi:tRNA-dihydrouridine synthase B